LAIQEKHGEEMTKQALDDWYLAPQKDYAIFANKYAMNGEVAKQAHSLKAMKQWCEKTNITFTPTFFLNGYQLPEMYTVNDLKHFLSI
jgi:protein-disulfide isomerase